MATYIYHPQLTLLFCNLSMTLCIGIVHDLAVGLSSGASKVGNMLTRSSSPVREAALLYMLLDSASIMRTNRLVIHDYLRCPCIIKASGPRSKDRCSVCSHPKMANQVLLSGWGLQCTATQTNNPQKVYSIKSYQARILKINSQK